MMLHQDEERISINHGLDLIQRKNGLKFGTDALLLSAFIGKHRKDALGIELGSGTGAISLLCLKRNQLQRIIALEVQPLYAALTSRNAALNGLSDRLEAVCTDLRDYPAAEQADVVFTNPPYMTADSGAEAEYEEKHLARHEVRGTIDDFCRCGARMLRYGDPFSPSTVPIVLPILWRRCGKRGWSPSGCFSLRQRPAVPPPWCWLREKRVQTADLSFRPCSCFKTRTAKRAI